VKRPRHLGVRPSITVMQSISHPTPTSLPAACDDLAAVPPARLCLLYLLIHHLSSPLVVGASGRAVEGDLKDGGAFVAWRDINVAAGCVARRQTYLAAA